MLSILFLQLLSTQAVQCYTMYVTAETTSQHLFLCNWLYVFTKLYFILGFLSQQTLPPRLAVKVSLDHVLIGLNSSSWPDLLEALTEYHSRWFFGPDDSSSVPRALNSSLMRETTSSDRVLSADLHSLVRGGVPDSPHADGSSAVLTRTATSNRVSNSDVVRGTADAREEQLPDQPQDWADAIRREVPNLFSVGYNEVKVIHRGNRLVHFAHNRALIFIYTDLANIGFTNGFGVMSAS